MKKLLAVIVLSVGLSGVATADQVKVTPQEFAHSVSQVPVKIGNFLSNEITKTKEFQKASWIKMKSDFVNLKNKFLSN